MTWISSGLGGSDPTNSDVDIIRSDDNGGPKSNSLNAVRKNADIVLSTGVVVDIANLMMWVVCFVLFTNGMCSAGL